MINKLLEISSICKSYTKSKETTRVLDNVSFDVYKGEFLSIVGTSGCGKTTLLNIISLLDKDYKGYIKYNFDKRNIAYMLQDAALFPWLNIYENARIIAKIKKIDNDKYINDLINRFGLEDFKLKFPRNLSGGMKQRVSLIRTIASNPSLLLLDEPFAQLDYQTRLKISKDIYDLAKTNGITVIMITHDISEAISLSDRVIVLSKRPSKIKKIYDIDIKNIQNPIERRNTSEFNKYYKSISEDSDIFNEE